MLPINNTSFGKGDGLMNKGLQTSVFFLKGLQGRRKLSPGRVKQNNVQSGHGHCCVLAVGVMKDNCCFWETGIGNHAPL